jgi:hypothetical protein
MTSLRTVLVRLLRLLRLYHPLHDWRRSHRFKKAGRAAVALWKSQGCPVPLPDIVKYEVIRGYARLHGTSILVETGTWFGNALFILRNDFNELHSIELAPELHAQARAALGHLHHIHLHLGDSAVLIPSVVPSLSAPALYWLDGHWCAGPSSHGEKETPISEELAFLLNRPAGQNVVLIDDARCFNGKTSYPAIEQLRAWVTARRPQSSFTVDNDIIRIVPV